jgi:hypothetical protein
MKPERFEELGTLHPCFINKGEDGTIYSVRTCPVKLAFVRFPDKKVAPDKEGRQKYSCVLLFPASADFAPLDEALDAVAEDEFGSKFADMKLHWPLKPQAPLAAQGYKGFSSDPNAEYLNVSTMYKPHFATGVTATQDWKEDDIWSGMIVRAVIVPRAFSVEGKKGTTFKLKSLQFVHKGEKILGTVDPSADYDAMDEEPGAYDDPPEVRVSAKPVNDNESKGPARTPRSRRS